MSISYASKSGYTYVRQTEVTNDSVSIYGYMEHSLSEFDPIVSAPYT